MTVEHRGSNLIMQFCFEHQLNCLIPHTGLFLCVFVQVIVWGLCRLEDSGDSVLPPEIKPCSSILDVGDSATAVAFCPVLRSDNRYTHTQPYFLLYYFGQVK